MQNYTRICSIAWLVLSMLLCSSPAYNASSPTPAAQIEQRKFDYFFLEAIKLKQTDRHAEAFNLLKYCLELDSTASSAHYEIWMYYYYLNRDDLVMNHLQKAVQYNPNNFEYKLTLANACKEMGMYEEAEKAYEELVQSYPEKPLVHYNLSEVYTKLGNTHKAIQALNTLEETVGIHQELSVKKHLMYNEINQADSANYELIKLANKFPTDARYPLLIGDLFLSQNKIDEAYTYFQKAYAIDSGNPYYTVSMAHYYELKGNKEASLLQIENALNNPQLDIESKLEVITRYISRLVKEKEALSKAAPLFKTLIEQHPQEVKAALLYANFLASLHKTEEAIFQYQLIIEMAPEEEAAWMSLLNLYLKEQNFEESIRTCKAAHEHFPQIAEFYFYEGMCLFQLKRYQEALDAYTLGAANTPPEQIDLLSDFYGQMGDTYHRLGNKELSYQHYDKALEYNEKNIAVMNNYAYFLSLDKTELSKAERMSARCVQAQPDNSTYIDTYAWVFFVQGNYSLAKFYIESALAKGGDASAEIVDHYGDILFKMGETKKALEQWKKAFDLGKDTSILQQKIADKNYYEDPNPE